MMFRWVLIFTFAFAAAFALGMENVRADSLPLEASIGAATIHRYVEPKVAPSTIAITVWAPMPDDQLPGQLINMNQISLPQDLPQLWIIGDGSNRRSLVGIDLSPSSTLSEKISQILAEAGLQGAGRGEELLNHLRTEINRRIAWTEKAYLNNGQPELPWDLSILADSNAETSFSQAASLPLFHFPVASGQKLPVVGLEKYLEIGKGYCLEKALLASLLLSRAGIEHRLVNGAVSFSPGHSIGHSWIELKDGRIFDPAWELVVQPTYGHPDHPDWIFVGNSWRFENQNYLILRVPFSFSFTPRVKRHLS